MMKAKSFFSASALCILILLFWTITACQKKAEDQRALLLSQIKQAAKLSTVELQVSKIVHGTYEKDLRVLAIPIKLRDASFVARTQATIKAGVDLSKVRYEDIRIEDRRLSLRLPPVEITSFDYPAERFEVLDAFSTKSPYRVIGVENIDRFFELGELSIREQVKNIGLAEKAETKIRTLFTRFLLELGYQEIRLEFGEAPAGIVDQVQILENMVGEIKEKALRLR